MFEMILSIIAVLFLLALGSYAIVKKRTAANVVLFVTVVLLSGVEIFDQLSLQLSMDFTLDRQISLYLESLLPASFLLLSLTYGRSKPLLALSKVRLALAFALSLFPLIMLLIAGNDLYYSPDFQSDRVLFLDSPGYWYYLAIMVSFIVSLVNVETTLSASRGIARYRMKFEIFGIMSLLAVQIFYYSQGLLYRTINLNLIPIRSSVFIVAVLLMGYSWILRGNNVRVQVSRHIFYRSIALFAIGIYLIIIGLIGEGMRYFGDTFEKDLIIIIGFIGGVLLLAMFLSEKLRMRIKVYVHKHFFEGKHDYREEWIKFTNRLSSCGALSDVQETVLAVYQETFGLAGASLYLLSHNEQRYVRTFDLAMPGAPVELRISGAQRTYFIERERVLEITNGEYPLSAEERSIFNLAGAWLIVPLISNHAIIGLVVLKEQIVPAKLMYDDYDLMKVLARQAAQAITNLKLSEELLETRAMAAVARISSFVIHDLKNLTSGLSLVVDNSEEHIGNPEFQKDVILTIRNTLAKMKSLMQRLKGIPDKNILEAGVQDIHRLSSETIAEIAKMSPGVHIEYEGSSVLSRVDSDEIRKVIVNLVQNAMEASDENGIVTVRTSKENGGVCIRVSDNGCGMTEDFVKDQLFRPFRTTKEKGLGIGLYQCKQIIEAHGGKIEVKSDVNKGTEFKVCLPAAEANQ
jgi:putative PEP-CTERM system histidine kinase